MLNLLSRCLDGYRSAPRDQGAQALQAPIDFQDWADGPYQLLSEPRQISELLEGLLHTNAQVRMALSCAGAWAATGLVHCDAAGRRLLVRRGGAESTGGGHLQGCIANLISEYKTARILFTLEVQGTVVHQGVDCLQLEWPRYGLRVQFRDSLRVTLPVRMRAVLCFAVRPPQVVEALLADLCEGGIGFLVDARRADGIVKGLELRDCVLQVEDVRLERLHLAVRHVLPLPSGKVFVGTQLSQVPEVQVQKIRRLVMQQQISPISREVS